MRGGKRQRTGSEPRQAAKTESRTLSLIRCSFPGRDGLIERSFRENRYFRDLCEDYRKCTAALHRWNKLQEKEAPPRWQEYSELLVELGREIQTWLESIDTEPPRPSGNEP